MDDSPWMPPGAGAPEPELAPPTLPPPSSVPPPPPAPESPWSRDAGISPLAPDQPTTLEPLPPEQLQRPRRSKLVVGGAIAAVVAVGAAGVFAVSQFTGSAQGGADSPTDLGTALLTAIENEDVLGMVDVLSPGERDLLRQPMIDLVSELTRLEVLSPEADLSKIAGLDIELEGESVTSRPTNVPDIVNVTLAADATSTIDGEVVPIGALVTDNMDPEMVAEMRGTDETLTEELEVELTAVELDGRWYFSLFHTAAEGLRRSQDPVPDIPADGVGADGGESPEAAVDLMLDRIQDLDLTGMIQALNPGEAAALQRYSPLFLEAAQAELDSVPIGLEITNRQFRVEGDGDQRTVLFDALTLAATIEDESGGEDIEIEIGIEGDCMHAVVMGETYDMCAGEPIPELDEFVADAPAIQAFTDSLSAALADIQPIGFEVRSFEGEWYLSPTATTSEAILAVLRALDRGEIDELLELGEAAADEFFELAFGGWGGSDDDYSFDEDLFEEDMFEDDLFEEDLFEDDLSDSVTGDDTATEYPEEACYQETDPAAAAKCFQVFVDSGVIAESMIPIELRFLDCGYADTRWGGALYSMSDEEFVAAVEAARPCFLAHLDSGVVDEWELPTEILNFECFENRNWYSTFDDPEYDERYSACIDAAWSD